MRKVVWGTRQFKTQMVRRQLSSLDLIRTEVSGLKASHFPAYTISGFFRLLRALDSRCSTSSSLPLFASNSLFHVKDVLTSFCRRVQTLKITFNLFQVDATSLIDYLSPGTFAQIEVG